MMLWNYLRFDFGDSYFRDISVLEPDQREDAGVDLARALDRRCSPICISIPLGIRKAVQDGSRLRRLDQSASSSSATPSRASCSPSC